MSVYSLDLPEFRLRYYKFGSGASPRVLITAALHGDEVTGVYSAYRLVEYLSKFSESVTGTIVVVPIVNVPGFHARTRHNPLDYVDLNRVFPDGAGSITTKIIVKTIWELALSSDYVIDLHCAGLNSYQYVLALYQEFPKVKEFTDLVSWDTVVESTGLRGQLFVEATHQGIPSIIIETAGGDGYYVEEWGDVLYQVVLQTLTELNAITGLIVKSVIEKTYYGRLQNVKTPVEGFPKPAVSPGDRVREGDVIAYVSDTPIKSSVTGKLIRVEKNTFVHKDDSIASIAQVSTQ